MVLVQRTILGNDQKWFQGTESRNLKESGNEIGNWNRESRLCEYLVVTRSRFGGPNRASQRRIS